MLHKNKTNKTNKDEGQKGLTHHVNTTLTIIRAG